MHRIANTRWQSLGVIAMRIEGPDYSDEERLAGIARLLAEAYCNKLRKEGRIKDLPMASTDPLARDSRYDFLH